MDVKATPDVRDPGASAASRTLALGLCLGDRAECTRGRGRPLPSRVSGGFRHDPLRLTQRQTGALS